MKVKKAVSGGGPVNTAVSVTHCYTHAHSAWQHCTVSAVPSSARLPWQGECAQWSLATAVEHAWALRAEPPRKRPLRAGVHLIGPPPATAHTCTLSYCHQGRMLNVCARD